MPAHSVEVSAPAPAPALSLFQNRSFVLLWLAQMVSSLGDWALMIAIPITVYDGTNSHSKLGLSFVAETTPMLLLGILAGVIADRSNRRRLMMVSDLGRMACVALLLNLHSLAHLGRRDLWLIYGVAFATASLSSFFTPARSSLMAALLPRERLMQANAVSSSGLRLTQLLGPALAGVLLHWLHPRGVFAFDALTFLFSAACVLFVTDPEARRAAPAGLAGVVRDLREGLGYLVPGTTLGNLILFLSLATFVGGIINTLDYAFVRDVLKISGAGFGYMLSAVGLGALLAVPLVAGPFKAIAPPRLIAAGFLGMAASGLGLAFAPNFVVGTVALFFLGLSNMLMYLPVLTMCQTEPPPEVRGRIMGAVGTVGAFFAVTSALSVAAVIGLAPSLRALFAVLSLIYLACGLLAPYALNPNRVTKRL